jgi:ATP-binding protein involved in chromosome partitioning
MPVTKEAVLHALSAVQDPDLHRDIVALGFVKELRIDGGNVSFHVELTTPACPVKDLLKKQATEAVARLPGVKSVHVEMTANVRGHAGGGAPGAHGHAHGAGAGAGNVPAPGVKNIIAVGAGKGGVGKSTVAVNLALGLLQSGARVGLLDADVFGPSVPKMLGNEGVKPRGEAPNRILPLEAHGLKTISMGYVLDPERAMVARGPIVHTVVRQFLADVVWGELDYLVVDLPPGTGDVALSLAQSVRMTGAVVVSTPQDVSLIDVHRAVSMFRSLKVPVLGLVENMSVFVCPSCGHHEAIFGHEGAEKWAATQSIPFLGRIPIHTSVRTGGDAGLPLLADPNSPAPLRDAFRHVAEELARQVSIAVHAAPAQPLIQIQGL